MGSTPPHGHPERKRRQPLKSKALSHGGVMYGLFHLHRLYLRRLYPFEVLAEISDFVAGLVQRVPKKTSIAKSDLQNSTASQGDDHL